jgi:hypothetical protein
VSEPTPPPHPADSPQPGPGINHLAHPAPAPGWLGQATAVEQSRAVAEVQGAIVVAQQVPRDIDRARALLQETCGRMAFAERAFWSYKRGREVLTGPTVQFARAAAGWWGNVQYGINELRRDDENAMSEMIAWAWDVQANVRASSGFLVPHLSDRSEGGPKRLTALRDIYENNANQASRRVREQILAVLPDWFVAEGVEIATRTLANVDKRSIKERQQGAAAAFDELGADRVRLEQKLGRPIDRWTVYDLTQLRIMLREVQTGVKMLDDVLPPVAVTRDELVAQREALGAGPAAGLPVYADDDPERPFDDG